MTTTVNKTTTIYDAFIDVFSMNARDSRWSEIPDRIESILTSDGSLFEGTASELLEIIVLGAPDDLPTDATRMSKPLSKIKPSLKALGITVDRFIRDKQRIIRVKLNS